MGYYSNFELSSEDFKTREELEALVFELNKIIPFTAHSSKDSIYMSEIKWYNWKTDMLKLSLTLKDSLLKVTVDGQEPDDNKVAYFRNGRLKEYEGTIVYPDLEEGIL